MKACPKGGCPVLISEIFDSVDRGKTSDEAEDHQVKIALEQVAHKYTVDDGVEQC
ncbi:hypothetical protein ES703_43485 [subsurface metagenome]